jgi:hypothetical protein
MEETKTLRSLSRAERKKRGDTLAMALYQTPRIRPASIAGYERQEPEGESMNIGRSVVFSSIRPLRKERLPTARKTMSMFTFMIIIKQYTSMRDYCIRKAGYQKEDAIASKETC